MVQIKSQYLKRNNYLLDIFVKILFTLPISFCEHVYLMLSLVLMLTFDKTPEKWIVMRSYLFGHLKNFGFLDPDGFINL